LIAPQRASVGVPQPVGAKAALRIYRHDRRWALRSRAVQDWIGGKPDPRPARLPDGR
jgi:hypothetical protein